MGRGKYCLQDGPAARRSSESETIIDVTGSSAIKAASYQAANEKLVITYTGGSMYLYSDVPAQTATDFKDAESKGRYLVEHVKDKYPFTLVLKEHYSNMDSSVISHIYYDSGTQQVSVTFTNSQKGVYKNVPWEIISAWEKADSKGKYFNSHIRNQYEYSQAA
jgi:hypothetical protein